MDFSRVSIRVNCLRTEPRELHDALESQGYAVDKVSWYDCAYTVSGREEKSLGRTIEYQLGHYYIQSLSSMVPAMILAPKPNDIVLDLAAAPGSKTTQMSMHMQNRGVIVANDSSYMRLKSLGSHIDRLGVLNACITNYDGRRFPSGIKFTKILVDAPCSSIGSRKGCISHSENRIRSLARLQTSLILRAFDLLDDGGVLVYSTCTTTIDENEDVVAHLLAKRPNAVIADAGSDIVFDYARGCGQDAHINENVVRYELDEAFFVAKIVKGSNDE